MLKLKIVQTEYAQHVHAHRGEMQENPQPRTDHVFRDRKLIKSVNIALEKYLNKRIFINLLFQGHKSDQHQSQDCVTLVFGLEMNL